MAPEALRFHKYSQMSDVYAFGILLWEVWSGGEIPFSTVAADEEVAARVHDGNRPRKPGSCPDAVYKIMENCWKKQPRERPAFARLKMDIQEAFAAENAARLAQEADQENLCVICMERAADYALLPCGHKCVCQQDAVATKQRGTCPVCRSQVQAYNRIFVQ